MPGKTLTLHVPDMSCGHCRSSIEKALAPMGLEPEFDMTSRTITIPGTMTDAGPVIAALEHIGFPSETVAR